MSIAIEKTIVDVKVNNLERAVAFYRDVLGLKVLHQAKDWASFNAASTEIHLYLRGGTMTGLEFRVRDIESATTHLMSKGVLAQSFSGEAPLETLPSGLMRFNWGKAFFFHDSEGNTLALVED